MKSVLLVPLVVLSGTAVAQNIVTHEKVLSDQTENVPIDLKTARCSSRGYSVAELKVSAPALADMGLFNHVNQGETQPCISAGRCFRGNMPESLGLPGSQPEMVDLRVQRVEVHRIDLAQHTCTRSLEERVTATIRGKLFQHLRSADLEPVPAEQCD
jgi:hypothetical protein